MTKRAESIYDIKSEKDPYLALKADSNSMGFAVFLKED